MCCFGMKMSQKASVRFQAYCRHGLHLAHLVRRIEAAGLTQRYRTAMIGGEVAPGLQDSIFTSGYSTGRYKQDFDDASDTVHPTYMATVP